MPVRNQNWYDLQAGRRYPLDDRSTGLDDTGNVIDDAILVDCNIRFPNTAGAVAFVQAITVSDSLVTVLIGAASSDQATATITTIAAINLPKPIQLNKNYPLTPIVPGVAGWLVFGSGIATSFTGRYATPLQSLILPRCGRPYAPLPIQTIGKDNLATSLSGVIELATAGPLVAEYTRLPINGTLQNAILFQLDNTLTNIDYNPFTYFLGPCGQRPESGTCPKQPIETINGIAPDCHGNINITTDPADDLRIYPFSDCGGMALYIPVGLTDVCNNKRYQEPRTPIDDCDPNARQSSSSRSSVSSSSSSLSSRSSSSNRSSSSSSAVVIYPGSLPICQGFTTSLTPILATRSGVFTAKMQPAPPKCSASAGSSSSVAGYASQSVCQSDSPSLNIATLNGFASDWLVTHKLTTEFKILPSVARNAGLIFNFIPASLNDGAIRYMLAVMDVDTNTFSLLRYNGSNFVVEYAMSLDALSFSFDTGSWHRISVTPAPIVGGMIATQCELTSVSTGQSVSFIAVVSDYGPLIGSGGLFADRSRVNFNTFKIE